jgi:hypothetical protein
VAVSLIGAWAIAPQRSVSRNLSYICSNQKTEKVQLPIPGMQLGLNQNEEIRIFAKLCSAFRSVNGKFIRVKKEEIS